MTTSIPVSKGMPDNLLKLAAATPVTHRPIYEDLQAVDPTSVLRTSKNYYSRGLLFSKDSVYGSITDSDEENKSFDLSLYSQTSSRQPFKDVTT